MDISSDILEKGMISIIMPVYNCKRTIRVSVGSCLQQTHKNLEIILVDDGSTDGSSYICDQLAGEDKRVKAVHQKNGGVSAARNRGIEYSKGEYIVFVDSDDLIHPRAIERMYKAAVQNSKKIVTSSLSFVYSEDQIQRIMQRDPDSEDFFFDTRRMFCDMVYKDPYIGSCCGKLFNRSVIQSVKFPSISMCEDQVFMLEMLSKTNEDVVLAGKKPLYCYVQRENSTIHSLSNHHLVDELQSAHLIMKIAEDKREGFEIPAKCYSMNVAFFTLFNAHQDKDYDEISERAMNIIKSYRWEMISRLGIPIKTKVACLLSYVSMDMLAKVYHFINK